MTLPPQVSDLTDHFLHEVDRRLPGRLTGLFLHGSICWGEFFCGSDIVGVWNHLPKGDKLLHLQAAHQSTKKQFPMPTFDGFHCIATDLASSPTTIPHRPVFFQNSFDLQGKIDINLVTWHELAERPVIIRGQVPPIYTDLDELIAFTRENLNTYWRGIAQQIGNADIDAFGKQDDAITWVTLGAARLHHLLSTGKLTSKSGAGRYIIDSLDPRWHKIAREALRLREDPASAGLYDDPTARGHETHALLAWLLQDGTGQGPDLTET